MNCPQCSAELLTNARFCGSCGYQMTAPPASNPPDYQNQTPPNYQNQQPNQQANYQNQSSGSGSFQFDADGRGQGRGYVWEIVHQGAFALAVVNLQRNRRFRRKRARWFRCRAMLICIRR